MLTGLAVARVNLDLVIEPIDAGLARTRGGLVGGDDELLETPSGMEGPERVDHRQGRAVGVADDALGAVADLGRIDLGHDERNFGIHPKGTGVVDYDSPVRHRDRSPLRRDLVWHVEHRDVDTVKDLRSDLLDRDILTPNLEDLAGRTCRRDEAYLAPDVRALAQDAEHDGTDSAGRADDGQGG